MKRKNAPDRTSARWVFFIRYGFIGLFALLPWWSWAMTGEAIQLVPGSELAWWWWPVMLGGLCFLIGMVAAMGGVGGGVLFVPIVSSFFPFHLDFVRGTGLMVALSCALAASPTLLRSGMANFRLTMLPALVASVGSIFGARIGLALPAEIIQTALGLLILAIVAVMARAKASDYPVVGAPDALARRLRMSGVYHEASTGQDVHWHVHRSALGLVLFGGIGFLAGVFGLGAGWANVPVLNLVMGAPIKVAAGSSMFILTLVDTTAAWVYLHQGAVLALITVPAVVGMMMGSIIGVRLFKIARPSVIRAMVLGLLMVSGLRALMKGTGVWP